MVAWRREEVEMIVIGSAMEWFWRCEEKWGVARKAWVGKVGEMAVIGSSMEL